MLFIPAASRAERPDHPDLRGLPIRFHPDVLVRQWKVGSTGATAILHREYATPAGKLTAAARFSDDWTHGDNLPFIDDFQIPRAEKFLVCVEKDLEALSYLLVEPAKEDIARFREEAAQAHDFVKEHKVLLAGGWGVGADMANWLCGMENFIMMTMTDPAFAARLLGMIHEWNYRRMKVVLSAPVDVYIRRAWYEGCQFMTPQFFKDTIFPLLKKETALAHEHGARFGYICTSGVVPMLDCLVEAGVDVLIGVDPIQGNGTDMTMMRKKADDKMSLWGGVSGAVTVERDTEQNVRKAVREAVRTLGPHRFVLSPIDNITVDAPKTWENVGIFIDEWRRLQSE
jgi:uroporphyrinogen-III decarboxylase